VNFIAFGDSLTEGRINTASARLVVLVNGSYPDLLERWLGERYSGQRIHVGNAGIAGERADQGALRLPGILREHTPEVLLLMEGANDLNQFGRPGISRTIGWLERMVKEARARNVIVFLASLPPQRRGTRSGSAADFLPEFNREVRATAQDEGAVFVDVYAAFGDDDSLIGMDGLHPSSAGYDRIALAFFTAIRAHLETTQ
jgi:acyl-CoA thioesterase I